MMQVGGFFGQGSSVQQSYGQAQAALSSAGGMMKLMKYAFIGAGALGMLGGAVCFFAVDAVTGISSFLTGAIFVGVALAVLPKFSGMLGQASAMVNGLAAKERLAQTGTPMRGRLVSVQQTGRLVNYNPEIYAVVDVYHPQFGAYRTETTCVVAQLAIPRVQPGAELEVRVNPQDPRDVALVF
jgi:hypothetical protein